MASEAGGGSIEPKLHETGKIHVFKRTIIKAENVEKMMEKLA